MFRYPLPFTISLLSPWIQKAFKRLTWMLHRPTTQTAATTTKTPLLHQPQDCENDRKSRLVLAFIALTYIQPREALVTGFLNKALGGGLPCYAWSPLTTTTPTHIHHTHMHRLSLPGLGREEKKDTDHLGVLQSLVSPAFYLSCLWLLQFKSCLPLRQEGQLVLGRH